MKEDVFSYANLGNAAFLDSLYLKYLEDPSQVDSSWRGFFSGIEFAKGANFSKESSGDVRVFCLIEAYKRHGHKKVLINPLQEKLDEVAELRLSNFGFTSEDLSKNVSTLGFLEQDVAPLATLIEGLEERFCLGIGFEMPPAFDVMDFSPLKLSKADRLKILDDLIKAEVFESFLHVKYAGQTRFSLEGVETLIPILNFILEKGSEAGLEEVVIGMPHRGRLNVLASVIGKSYLEIFQEFEETLSDDSSGDVKYHKGEQSNLKMASGSPMAVTLVSNPSHLESINPVIEGEVRAKQELKGLPLSQKKVAAILIHGDASFAGQGIVYETLQMSKLPGYETGGTLHIIVNNHIGYTALPSETRSTPYCTDIAKAFGAPVFHVNAERPEECMAAALFAVQIRQTFQVDVFIDLNCYRKYGHNEGDEPSFTQPLEYKKIRKKQSIRLLFEKKLLQEGVLSQEDIIKKEDEFKVELQEALALAIPSKREEKEIKTVVLTPLKADIPPISIESLSFIVDKLSRIPDGWSVHSKIQRILGDRHKILEDPSKAMIDWGMGENMAYASLLLEDITVRLSGQDVIRGTFSHRHASLVDQETAEKYFPLNHLKEGQAPCFIYNSFLSEFGVMGFDLGYSYAHPNALVLWEAQFGDFVNEAQVIIDQYLSTSEQKWGYKSNMTLLLPHGYEGKGPEHSSARMERFLQLCAEDNFIIANCTTPAQFFHLIRRQAYITSKKPLVVFTPKLLLRHPSCLSSLNDLVNASFYECLDDPIGNVKANKAVLCSGKIFYDLLQEREERGGGAFVILRIEQLYPFPESSLERLIKAYPNVKEVVWVQEESKNMGAWNYMKIRWEESSLKSLPLSYIGRDESASPATGSYLRHKKEYKTFMQKVFTD